MTIICPNLTFRFKLFLLKSTKVKALPSRLVIWLFYMHAIESVLPEVGQELTLAVLESGATPHKSSSASLFDLISLFGNWRLDKMSSLLSLVIAFAFANSVQAAYYQQELRDDEANNGYGRPSKYAPPPHGVNNIPVYSEYPRTPVPYAVISGGPGYHNSDYGRVPVAQERYSHHDQQPDRFHQSRVYGRPEAYEASSPIRAGGFDGPAPIDYPAPHHPAHGPPQDLQSHIDVAADDFESSAPPAKYIPDAHVTSGGDVYSPDVQSHIDIGADGFDDAQSDYSHAPIAKPEDSSYISSPYGEPEPDYGVRLPHKAIDKSVFPVVRYIPDAPQQPDVQADVDVRGDDFSDSAPSLYNAPIPYAVPAELPLSPSHLSQGSGVPDGQSHVDVSADDFHDHVPIVPSELSGSVTFAEPELESVHDTPIVQSHVDVSPDEFQDTVADDYSFPNAFNPPVSVKGNSRFPSNYDTSDAPSIAYDPSYSRDFPVVKAGLDAPGPEYGIPGSTPLPTYNHGRVSHAIPIYNIPSGIKQPQGKFIKPYPDVEDYSPLSSAIPNPGADLAQKSLALGPVGKNIPLSHATRFPLGEQGYQQPIASVKTPISISHATRLPIGPYISKKNPADNIALVHPVSHTVGLPVEQFYPPPPVTGIKTLSPISHSVKLAAFPPHPLENPSVVKFDAVAPISHGSSIKSPNPHAGGYPSPLESRQLDDDFSSGTHEFGEPAPYGLIAPPQLNLDPHVEKPLSDGAREVLDNSGLQLSLFAPTSHGTGFASGLNPGFNANGYFPGNTHEDDSSFHGISGIDGAPATLVSPVKSNPSYSSIKSLKL